MKTKQLLIFALILLSGSLADLFAQNRITEMPAADRAQLQTNRMKETLNLDSLQVLRILQINLAYAQKMDPILRSTQGKLSKYRAFQDLNTAKEKDLKTVLNKVQFQQWRHEQEAVKKEIRDRRK